MIYNNLIDNRTVLGAILKHKEKLPHAILLSGPAGVGKAQLAFELAKALLCLQPGADNIACGQCRNCHMVSAMTHPDLMLVGLEQQSSQKTASEIKVDQVRSLCVRLSHTSQFGSYKIAIIDPADRMNRNAANSLLKTLEEPAGNTLILLLSSRPSKLPATIRSRCRHIKLSAQTSAEALDWLRRHYADHDAESLLAAADGVPQKAQVIVDEGLLDTRKKYFESFIAIANRGQDPVAVAAIWCKSSPEWLFTWLLGWIEDLVKLRFGQSDANINRDLQKDLHAVSKSIDLKALYEFYDYALHASQLLHKSINVQLLLESVLIKWCRISQSLKT